MIVAWHEVPGTAPPQKTRPVGYGMNGRTCVSAFRTCKRYIRSVQRRLTLQELRSSLRRGSPASLSS
jgi:hypothetical protein